MPAAKVSGAAKANARANSHSRASTISGVPQVRGCFVQVATAVSRKATTTAPA